MPRSGGEGRTDKRTAGCQAGKGAAGLRAGAQKASSWKQTRLWAACLQCGLATLSHRAQQLPRAKCSRWVNSGPHAWGTSGTQVFGLQSGSQPASKDSLSPLFLTSPPSVLSKEQFGVVALVRWSQMAKQLLSENLDLVFSPLPSLNLAFFYSCWDFPGKGLGGSEMMFPALSKQVYCLIRMFGVIGVQIPQKSWTHRRWKFGQECCKERLSFISMRVLQNRNSPLGACGLGCGRRGLTG